ncbi:MAG: DUF1549 and DUF1553 domain-containing protein [Verrucomicrobiales bacterium]
MKYATVIVCALVTLGMGDGAAGTEKHWAFQPLLQHEIPENSAEEAWSNPVDAFIFARLAAAGLNFTPEADKATLLRRVTFDLTGLPPAPEQVTAFLNDDAPDAYERLIDRLLASPRYGERWAQHWLDAARFAESDGFEFDHERPEAWRYRDWVVDSLNADISFAEFVRAQIAGDEMQPPAATATGFLMAGPDMIDINLPEERRHNFLNDMTSTTGAVFLGLSVGCAQCHDHKSDPVSIHDFYSLRAFFDNTVVDPKKSKQLPSIVSEPGVQVASSHVCERGDFRHPGDPVEPAYLTVLNDAQAQVPAPPSTATSSMRRTALADWLTDGSNPLPYRVMANRLWLHHFGRGIVDTPNDFGKLGGKPSHPELLDWLALELARDGAGFKAIHRTLVTSRTYRQASHLDLDNFQQTLTADPENKLFSRMERHRLSGEAIRDAALMACGQLNLKSGGQGVRPPLPKEVRSTLLTNQWNVTEDVHEHSRRSLYLFVRRNLRFPMFDVFDRPDTNESCGRRLVSTTAPQALTLFNSEFSRQQAQQLAELLLSKNPVPADCLPELYLRVLSRFPQPDELEIARRFLQNQSELLAGALPRNSDRAKAGLADFCLALLNSNEAVYTD